MKINNSKFAACLFLTSYSLFPLTGLASGFRIPEISIAGIGTSNALVADAKTLGALPYNPAAMAFHADHNLVVGVINIQPGIEATPDGGKTTKNQADANVQTPSIYYMDHINQKITWGVSINTPFGLETKWPDETFPSYAGLADPLEPEQSKLEMVNVNPNAAFKFNDNTSVAFGIDYYLVKKLIFNTQAIGIEGDGRNFGWNIAALHTHDAWSVGLSYRSSVSVDLNGSVDATSLGSTKSNASAKLEFPSLFQIGARYQINNTWEAEFDIERTGWSSFDTIKIEHASPSITNPITSTHSWSNTTTYRIGGKYQAGPATEIRFGYTRDATPQSEKHFSARVPDNDRQAVSIGFAHSLGQSVSGLTVEAGYMYVSLDDRVVTATARENGKYESSAHLVGIGLTSRF